MNSTLHYTIPEARHWGGASARRSRALGSQRQCGRLQLGALCLGRLVLGGDEAAGLRAPLKVQPCLIPARIYVFSCIVGQIPKPCISSHLLPSATHGRESPLPPREDFAAQRCICWHSCVKCLHGITPPTRTL